MTTDRAVRPVCSCGKPMHLVVNNEGHRTGAYGCKHCDALCRRPRSMCALCETLHRRSEHPSS
jgi:hypothetical protein